MSVLSKIRDNVGLVIILIAISLAAFILTDLFRGISGGGNDNSVGTVAGEKIDYSRLAQKIDLFQRNIGGTSDSEQEYQLRQQAWDNLVNEVLYDQEFDDLGLVVSEDEISQMYLGPWVHRFIQQVPDFRNPATQQFSPDTVRRRLQLASQINLNDQSVPNYLRDWKQFMIDLRRSIIQDRLEQKYQGLLRGGVFATANEAKRRHIDQNKKVSISYVEVPYSTVKDEEVTVSDADFKAYYDKVKSRFEQDLSVTIQYAAFPIVPSKSDSTGKLSEIQKIAPSFLEEDSTSLIQFVLSNSDGGVDTSYKVRSEIAEVVASKISETGIDTVFGPILNQENGTYVIYRVTDTRDSVGVAVHARHILIPIDGNEAQDTLNARATADDLRRRANNDNFADLVKDNSKDFITQGNGGDLGWISTGSQGEGSEDFDKVITDAAVGSVSVAQSGRGFHVVQILERDRKGYQVMAIARNISAGYVTTDSVNKMANQFAGTAAATGSLDSAGKDFPSINIQTSGKLTPSSTALAGVKGARPVISWALKSDEGELAESILQTENAFVVAKVIEKSEAGVAPLDEVKDQIRLQVYNKKKAEVIKNKLSGSDLNTIAASAGVQVQQSQPLTFYAKPNTPMFGVQGEHLVVGAAFGLEKGQVSVPIAGNNAVYVIRVDNVTEAPPLDENSVPLQKQMVASTKRQSAVNKFFMGLRDAAEIEDRRYKLDY